MVITSSVFDGFDEWMSHGFGTRHAVDWPGETATLKQIHSSDVVIVQSACTGELGSGDALVTAEPGVRLSIRTADCVPLLFADPVKRVVAATHAGWRGTAARISLRTIERMVNDYGCLAADIRTAIGPAIGPCCYEVSEDVAVQFPGYAPGCGKTMLDLCEINRAQLVEAGVQEIDAMRLCTRCDSEQRFHSFRRDGERSGRMHAVIGLARQGVTLK
jgi:polyphenol oxidase